MVWPRLNRASVAGLSCDGAASVPPPPPAGFTVRPAVRVVPPNEAVIVATVEVVTADVVTVNVRLVAPAGTVTLAGTVADAELSDSVTTAPPDGAAAVSVTVPVDELPPTTVVGLTDTADSVAAAGARVIPSAANSVVLLSVAFSWTVVLSTGNVVMVNDALVAPAGMVTVGGTLAEPGRLLPRLTVTPPEGAGLSIVTVPVDGEPPCTLVGLTEKPVSVGRLGATRRLADCVTPDPVTEIVTDVAVVTVPVVITKLLTSVDAGMVTNAGTDATAGLLLVTRTS